MKFTTKLTISALSTAEFIQLITSSVDILEQNGSLTQDSREDQLVKRLKAKLPQLLDGFKQKRKSDFTEPLALAKKHRNEDLAALRSGINIYRNSRQQTKAEAYQQLTTLLREHRGISRVNTEESLALTTSLLQSLSHAHYQILLTELGLMEAYQNFSQSHQHIYRLYHQRLQSETGKSKINTMQVRKELDSDYRLLYRILSDATLFNPTGPEATALKSLNGIRKDYMDNRKRKKTKEMVNENLPA